MSSPALKQALLRLARGISSAPEIVGFKSKRNLLFWVVRRDRWFMPCFCGVSEYSPDCIRIKDGLTVTFPRALWPDPDVITKPPRGKSVEITMHSSEVTPEVGVRVATLFTQLETPEIWPEFQDSPHSTFPGYAWTRMAHDHQEARDKQSRRCAK